MSDALRRAIRTFFQTFIGVLLSSNFLSAVGTTGLVDVDGLLKVMASAAAAGFTSVLTYVQNALEDNTTMPALLKAPASEGENPVPDPPVKKKAAAVKKAAKKAR